MAGLLESKPPGERGSALAPWRKNLLEAAAGKLTLDNLNRSARHLEQSLLKTAARQEKEAKRSPEKQSLLHHFRAR